LDGTTKGNDVGLEDGQLLGITEGAIGIDEG
jgi:hypothetical protein